MEDTEAESPIKEVPLAELGAKLPIGMRQGSEFHRSFTVRPWRMKEEKVLAKAKKDAPGQNLATYVGTVVSYMCPQLGHHSHDPEDASDKALAERRVHLSQMFMADVWYAYVYIRRESLGDEIKLNLTCPRCRKSFPWNGSLSTLGVRVPKSMEDAMWEYELHTPMQVRGKTVEKLHLGPQIWSVAEDIYSNPDDAQAKDAAIRSSVYRLNDDEDPVRLVAGDLDELTKRDIEGLAKAIDEHFVGPNMAIELGGDTPCPNSKCGYNEPRVVPIDWSYDHFFGVSST